MSNSEPLIERVRTTAAAPLRLMGRLAIEHLPLQLTGHNNRYNQHVRELRQVLSGIPTHHAEHSLLRNFISELSRQRLGRSWDDEGKTERIHRLPVRAGVRHDNIMLLTKHLTGETMTDQQVVKGAHHARLTGRVEYADIDAACKQVVLTGSDLAVIYPNKAASENYKIDHYLMPTIIDGVVMGFSGPAISGSDSYNAEAFITFYSVPPVH